MFTRNFMKAFPIRKYANLTAKSTIILTQAEASPAIFGSSTKQKSDSQDQLFTSLWLLSCSSPLITSTLSMRSSDTRRDQLPTRYLATYSAVWEQYSKRSVDPQPACYWRIRGNQQNERIGTVHQLRAMINTYIITIWIGLNQDHYLRLYATSWPAQRPV